MPLNLSADQFRSYPVQARALATAHLALLRQMPLSLLPSLLRELIEYDYKFPAERAALEHELAILATLDANTQAEWFADFSRIRLTGTQVKSDWVARPAQFTDELSAYLWATHQMDSFRAAATVYGQRMRTSVKPDPLPMRRLGMTVVGQGVATYDGPLFRKLKEHGTYFNQVDPDGGLKDLLTLAAERGRKHPAPYAHWYVDGGASLDHDHALTGVSYGALAPVRLKLLKEIERAVAKPGMGPEELHTRMTELLPADLGLEGDVLLDRFKVKLLTEGSGTQIFSTTFAQWAAREILRRAEAVTLLVRFAPRQRERPLGDLLSSSPAPARLDPLGSLMDGEMAAYYQWINQQRLPEAESSSFVAWFEGHNQAVAIGPTLPRGTQSTSKVGLKQLVALATA